MNREKIEGFIENYYKTMDHVRLTKWNYEDGCILLAAIELFKATGNKLYRDFVVKYMSSYVLEDGTIQHYSLEDYNLDNIAPGRAIIFAYEETGEERFYKAVELLMKQLKEHPRTESGNFWHKKIYPNQIWLDGLFMAQPFYMAVETKFGKKDGYSDMVAQYKNVRKNVFDEEKGLYYHAFDESRQVFWADKETGCSKNFWLRALGWYQMSMIETMEEMPKAVYEHYHDLQVLFKESLKGILNYQDSKSKLFYQVINHPEIKGNYLETSGSAMIAASILKACRMKVLLSEKYWHIGEEILKELIEQKLVLEEGQLVLKDCCEVAGLGPSGDTRRDGTIEYYLSEPVINNDNKAIAALFLAYAQYIRGGQH